MDTALLGPVTWLNMAGAVAYGGAMIGFFLSYPKRLAPGWLLETFMRYYRQNHAVFYSDNAPQQTLYITRNRELATMHDFGPGATVSYTLRSVPGKFDVKLSASYQFIDFHYADYTDTLTGKPYSYKASVLNTVLSATF